MNADVKKIKDRCWINPETGCWEWKGALSGGWPRVHGKRFNEDGSHHLTPQVGRRTMWQAVHQKAIPNGWRVAGLCGCDTCLNPVHLKAGTSQEVGRQIAMRGALKGSPKRMAASRRLGLKKTKVTPAMYRLVLASDKTGAILSRELGISTTTIGRIRNGGLQSVAALANPMHGLFSGLVAANQERKRA